MFSLVAGLIQGLAGIFIGVFKTDKPKKETVQHVERKDDLLGSSDTGNPI